MSGQGGGVGGEGEWSTPFGLDLFSDNVFNVGEHCHASI